MVFKNVLHFRGEWRNVIDGFVIFGVYWYRYCFKQSGLKSSLLTRYCKTAVLNTNAIWGSLGWLCWSSLRRYVNFSEKMRSEVFNFYSTDTVQNMIFVHIMKFFLVQVLAKKPFIGLCFTRMSFSDSLSPCRKGIVLVDCSCHTDCLHIRGTFLLPLVFSDILSPHRKVIFSLDFFHRIYCLFVWVTNST